MISAAQALCLELEQGEFDARLAALTDIELAALEFDWSFWARPKQRVPQGKWRSHGFLTARGFGKTRSNSEFVVDEVEHRRAMRIGLMAQNEDKTIEVMIEGEDGLIARSPPWFPAQWERGRLVWPNGAQAFVFTPERPGNIRGPGVELMWLSEIQSWPASTRDEALANAALMTRLGYGKTIWEATPKRRHPLLRVLLRDAELNPERHIVVTGTTAENAANLADGFLDDLIARYAGTQRGKEELEGIYSDDDQGAFWQQEWIDAARRELPRILARRIIILDPAISQKKGTDQTGFSELGLGVDGQVYVIADLTERCRPEEWSDRALDRYVAGRCDCIVAERNRGGDLIAGILRARAESRERITQNRTLQIIEVGPDAPTRHVPGTVYLKVVHAKESKAERAAPVAALSEQGRISHPLNPEELAELEDLLCTWEPGPGDSPDRMDPFVWGVWELTGIAKQKRDAKKDVDAAHAALQRIRKPTTAEISVFTHRPQIPRRRL